MNIFVKMGWGIIIIGSLALVMLMVIWYDVRPNVEQMPIYSGYLGILSGISYILGFVLIVIAPRIKKKSR